MICGIAIREVLAPFTGHPYDFELWVRLGYYVSRGGNPYVSYPPVSGLSFPAYESPTWPGYPPLWPLFLAAIYKFYSAVGIQNRFFYYFLIKQPMVVSDIGVAFLLSKLVSIYSSAEKGFRAFAFWLLCPYTIIISSVWGMFDQIILLLVLLSIYFLSGTIKSSFLESLAIALKLVPIIFLPLLAGVQSSKKRVLSYLGLGAGFTLLLAYSPYLFFRSWSVQSLNNVEIADAGRVANSVNYWELVVIYSQYRSFSPLLLHALIYLAWIWVPAVILASLYCISAIRQRTDLKKNLMTALLFVTLVFFLTKSAISEQFVIYFLGLALFDYYVLSSARRKKLFYAVWLSALFYLILNSQLLDIFLSPLSPQYANLNFFYGRVSMANWDILIGTTSITFSICCLLYLISLFRELRRVGQRKGLEQNAPGLNIKPSVTAITNKET